MAQGNEAAVVRRLRVAVIGLGVGAQHAAAYGSSGGCDVVALCDLAADKRAVAAAQYPHARIAVDADEVLKDPGIDVVSIASYDDVHYQQARMALQAGKHVFVEKPLCRSMEELRAIKAAWVATGQMHLASNLVLRASPLYRWLRDVILAGELGELYAFDGDYLYGRLHKITDEWRKDVEDYSALQGGGIHLVDLMLWFASQRPTSVTAVGNRICTRDSTFRYNDFVAATFRFPSGLVGRITANFGCVHRHQHVVRVFGTKGTFSYDDLGPRLHTSRSPDGAARGLDLAPLPASKGELIPGFVAGILKGEDPRGQAHREFDVISACAAADLALASEREVLVEYV